MIALIALRKYEEEGWSLVFLSKCGPVGLTKEGGSFLIALIALRKYEEEGWSLVFLSKCGPVGLTKGA